MVEQPPGNGNNSSSILDIYLKQIQNGVYDPKYGSIIKAVEHYNGQINTSASTKVISRNSSQKSVRIKTADFYTEANNILELKLNKNT